MSDRPVRDRRPSTWLANYVVPVGGVRRTPPRNQTQRQRRQQSPVDDGAADIVGEQDDRHDQYVPANQVPPVAVIPVVRQEDIQQLDNLDVQDPEPVDLPDAGQYTLPSLCL